MTEEHRAEKARKRIEWQVTRPAALRLSIGINPESGDPISTYTFLYFHPRQFTQFRLKPSKGVAVELRQRDRLSSIAVGDLFTWASEPTELG